MAGKISSDDTYDLLSECSSPPSPDVARLSDAPQPVSDEELLEMLTRVAEILWSELNLAERKNVSIRWENERSSKSGAVFQSEIVGIKERLGDGAMDSCKAWYCLHMAVLNFVWARAKLSTAGAGGADSGERHEEVAGYQGPGEPMTNCEPDREEMRFRLFLIALARKFAPGEIGGN